jgi:hypothetical protein
VDSDDSSAPQVALFSCPRASLDLLARTSGFVERIDELKAKVDESLHPVNDPSCSTPGRIRRARSKVTMLARRQWRLREALAHHDGSAYGMRKAGSPGRRIVETMWSRT